MTDYPLDEGTADVNNGELDYLPARQHDMAAFGRVIPDESTRPTPENIIVSAIQNDAQAQQMTIPELAGQIMRDLELAGFQVIDTLNHGEELTEGAGPDETCGCGEPITMYDGEWVHIYNEELRGTGDHDAEPG